MTNVIKNWNGNVHEFESNTKANILIFQSSKIISDKIINWIDKFNTKIVSLPQIWMHVYSLKIASVIKELD